MAPVQLQVLRQAAPGLLQIRSRLVQRQGQAAKLPREPYCFLPLGWLGLGQRSIEGEQPGSPQEQQGCRVQVERLDLDAPGQAAQGLSARREQHMPSQRSRQKLGHEGQVIRVIKNQEPGGVLA